MSGLIRNVLIPASKRAHQGAMSMFVPGYSPNSSPRHTYSTGAGGREDSSPVIYPWNPQLRHVWWSSAQKPVNPMTDDEELKIRRVFGKYDKNNDGWISRGEWYDVVFKFLGDQDAAWILAEKIMDDLDVDPKDEKVTYSEFRAGMKSHWHLFKPKISNVEK